MIRGNMFKKNAKEIKKIRNQTKSRVDTGILDIHQNIIKTVKNKKKYKNNRKAHKNTTRNGHIKSYDGQFEDIELDHGWEIGKLESILV